jgi:catechol 2,3-dioxygenase-like lactoylglutathione lyase family enzyme
MFDHVTIRVSDRVASERFYETVLTPLGLETTYRTATFSAWQDFLVTQTTKHDPVTRGLHVGFAAPSREQVDAFWQAGTGAGYPDDGAPGERKYTPEYYGAFLRDPDGNSIEAVHHEGVRRHGEIIDHIWLRVADLEASTAFYHTVAAIAGFEVKRDDGERSTFSGPRSGGSFSLVRGHPTEHLHLAFPGEETTVRRFYEELVAAGYESNGEPGERARYHPGYYAAYVLDPDGNNIEIVDHHRPS